MHQASNPKIQTRITKFFRDIADSLHNGMKMTAMKPPRVEAFFTTTQKEGPDQHKTNFLSHAEVLESLKSLIECIEPNYYKTIKACE